MRDELLLPYGIYDKTKRTMVYLGLHRDSFECWNVYLGWPSEDEIKHAQASGKICLSPTVTYDPEKPIEGFAA